jgi:integrase/recombinase XerC
MTPWQQHIDDFIFYIEKNKRMSIHTTVAYRGDLEQFLAFLITIGNPGINQLKATHVRAWMSDMMQHNIAPRSIHRKISSLRALVKHLRKDGVIDHDPLIKISVPKTPKHLVKDIPAEDLKNMFERFPWNEVENGQRDRLLLLLFYTSGMRLSELVGLKTSDVDLSRNMLRVLGKRNKVRLIPLHDEGIDLLKLYVATIEKGYLFTLESGEPLYPVFVYRLVNKYLKLFSHASKTSPHVLRHSFATHMLNNGANLMAIKDILGHANLSATQVYTKNSFEKLKKIHQLHPRK